MIVPMKKYSFLVYHKEYLDFLEGLREVGVLHVIEKASGEIEDENLRLNYQQINELKNAIRFLAKREVETQVKGKSKDGLEVLEDLKKLQADQEDYQHKLTQLKKERSLLEPWGEFSWRTLEKLDNAGYRIRFYICPSRDYNPEWETLFSLFLINDIAGQKYFIVAGKKDETVEIDAESVHLPKTSLSVLNKDIADIESILVKTEGYYDKMAALSLTDMRRTQERLLSELKFNKVLLSTHKEAEDKVMFLEGWVPVDTETKLLDFLNRENIYYESSEASEEDKVPIKLKNSRFARLFEPIGRLYMLPTHKELDLTPFFAPFFMLFFGFCLGDAGYGLFILAVSLLMRKRVKPNLRPFLDLGIYLSLATILFGFISGTFFGINLIDTGYMLTAGSIAEMQNSGIPSNIIETVRPLIGIEYTEQAAYLKAITEVLPDPSVLADYKSVFLKVAPSNYNFLNLFRYRMLDTNNMMYLSLVLGYIQIVFGMFIKTMNIIIFKGLKYAFSMFGWLLIVLGGGIAYMLKFFGIIQPDLGISFYIVF